MKQADTLPNAPLPLASMHFDRLLEAGLNACQELAGDRWTDYNEHDPGVTILEQLSYALTDLGYRVNYSVADLLAPPPELAARQRARRYDTLYSGDSVLSSQPLTALDYRKLIYDRVTGVRNVWLESSNGEAYRIVIERESSAIASDELKTQVAHLFHQHRNLGEDMASVTVLEHVPLHLEGQLHVSDHADPVEVFASVLFSVKNMLSPYAAFLSVEDRMNQGQPADAIFEGPLLSRGILAEDGLSDRRKQIDEGELLRTMLKVAGVVSVMKPQLRRDDNKSHMLSEHEVYTLVLPDDGVKWHGLRILWKGYHYEVAAASVRARLDQMNGEVVHGENYSLQLQAAMAYRNPAEGRYRNVAQYDSIQHQFPLTYGIGVFGVPEQSWIDGQEHAVLNNHLDPVKAKQLRPRTRRLAQARQLKAYLLFFEQILANHGAQIANLGNLFSCNPQLDRSYFFAPLAHAQPQPGDVPDFLALLMPSIPEPVQPETLRHVVQIRARRRHGAWPLLLRSRETGSEKQATLYQRDILHYGQQRSAFRRKPMRDGSIHLILRGSGGQALAFGAQRYRTRHAARRALQRITAWIRCLAQDEALCMRYLELKARGVLELVLWSEAGVKLLGIGQLRQTELVSFGDAIITAGQLAGHYTFPASGHGTLKLQLGEGGQQRHAVGFEHVCNPGEAEAARQRVVSWLCRLEHDTTLRARYLRCDHVPAPAPEPTLDAYLRGMAAVVHKFDPVLERRHQFLDHLLARFGETYDDRVLASFDPRPPAEKGIFSQELARWKASFLYHLAPPQQDDQDDQDEQGYEKRRNLAGRRIQGGNYMQTAVEAASGLEQRLRLLLGIANDQPTSAQAAPGKVIEALPAQDYRALRRRQVRKLHKVLAFARLSSPVSNTCNYAAMSKPLLRRLLRSDTMRGCYQIFQSSDEQWHLELAYRGGDGLQHRRILATARDHKGARTALDTLITLLRRVSVSERKLELYQDEDMTVLESVLLRRRTPASNQPLHAFPVNLVFPDWPIRFRDQRWRDFVFQLAAEQCPAHLVLRCYWLAPQQMAQFMRRQHAWREALVALGQDRLPAGRVQARYEAAAQRMTTFLQRLDQGGRISYATASN